LEWRKEEEEESVATWIQKRCLINGVTLFEDDKREQQHREEKIKKPSIEEENQTQKKNKK